MARLGHGQSKDADVVVPLAATPLETHANVWSFAEVVVDQHVLLQNEGPKILAGAQ